MAQANHINKQGHELVANLIYEWFANQDKEVFAHFKFDTITVENNDTLSSAEDNMLNATLTKASIVNDDVRGQVLQLTPDLGKAKLSGDPIGEASFSISFWYNSAETRYWKYFMTFKESQGRDLLGMNIQAWSTPKSLCFYRNTISGFASTKSQLATNQWYHVAFVASNGSAQIYIDGQQKHALDFPLDGYNFTDFYIGSDAGKTASTKIDDLMFYKEALSSTDVLSLYEEQKDGTPTVLRSTQKSASTFQTAISDKNITIKPEQNFNWTDTTCSLYSTDGKFVKSHNLTHSTQIDCSHLPNGVYILTIGKDSDTILLQ